MTLKEKMFRLSYGEKETTQLKEDFPDPESPVITVSVFRGISTSICWRLCWAAPRMTILSSINSFTPEILNG